MNDRANVGRSRAQRLGNQAGSESAAVTKAEARRFSERIFSVLVGSGLIALLTALWNVGVGHWHLVNRVDAALAPIHGQNFRDLMGDVYDQHRPIDGKSPREQINAILRECKHTREEGHRMKQQIRDINLKMNRVKSEVHNIEKQITEVGKDLVDIARDQRIHNRLERLNSMDKRLSEK